MGDIERFWKRRSERLRSRLMQETDLFAKYRILKALYQNRRNENVLDKTSKSNTIIAQETPEFNGDYGVPGMKWGVRKEKEEKSSENSGVKKTKLTQFKTENGVMTVTDDTKARLGSKGSVRIAKGKITDVEIFAGKGAKKPMELADKFAATYGGKPEDWMHSTGNGKIKFADGTEKNAEIHWFECEGIGQTKWKIKKFKKG